MLHKCVYCSYTSKYSIVLKRHLLLHTKEKPFLCIVCKQSFGRNDALARHIKRIHCQQKPTISTGQPAMSLGEYDDAILQLKHPFTCIVAGPTKVGKTEWVLKLVDNASKLIDPAPARIIWCYTEWQSKYSRLLTNPNVILAHGLPTKETLKGKDEKCAESNPPTLLVLDDMMDTMKGDKQLTELFIKGCHHWNISCIHICQSLFFTGLRTLRINAHYLVLMKSPSDKLQIATLARQMYPGQSKSFLDVYKDATSTQYGYLIVDCSPEMDDKLRLRSHIFPDEGHATFWVIS
jgi:Poxvirus A32 protein